MPKISLKKQWVSSGGYRGYSEPKSAVCGANDTGMWSDSPCRSDVATKELWMAKSILRKNNIPFRHIYCESSNVFCSHRYLCVPDKDIERAKELIEPIIKETTLLYIV